MIKIFTKTLVISAFICLLTFSAKAQIGYDYSKYDIGTSVSFNTLMGDAQTTKTTEAINFNLTYNTTPFVNFVFEVQLGKLTEGDSLKTSTGRYSNNDFYAFESLCTHAMFELDDAPIEDCTITCPLHGAKFCLKSGEVLAPPAYEGLQVFPVRIENGEVQIAV